MNLAEVAHELATRLIGTFERNSEGRRPVFGGSEKFQNDPHWRDNILFYEYFHGDNGAGVGASHQTGWTGCIARIIQVDGLIAEALAAGGRITQESMMRRATEGQREQELEHAHEGG